MYIIILKETVYLCYAVLTLMLVFIYIFQWLNRPPNFSSEPMSIYLQLTKRKYNLCCRINIHSTQYSLTIQWEDKRLLFLFLIIITISISSIDWNMLIYLLNDEA